MKNLNNNLFFSLIRVSIGTTDKLLYTPTQEEWQKLYESSIKQTLIGFCFNGVQRIYKNHHEQAVNLSTELRMRWLGLTVSIQKQNEVMNEYTQKTLQFFRKNSFPCQVLKGQGVALLYESLAQYRQSGDIDVWLIGGRNKVYAFSNKVFGKITGANYHHIHFPMYDKVEIEAHIYPSFLSSPFRNRSLHRFCRIYQPYEGCADYPSLAFNRVFILLHCYRHLCGHGVGMRQFMDYYYVLNKGFTEEERKETLYWCRKLGMKRFVKATMWLMKNIFGLADEFLLCEPDEKEGRFLLNEIMYTGNMGKSDTRFHWGQNTAFSRFVANQKRNIHLLTHYPHEVCWSPFFNIVRFAWLKCKGL